MRMTATHASLRFLHAADLHLDAAFKGLSSSVPAGVGTILRDATFTAWSRLVDAACALRPDFVLLGGDIYNQEDGSLRAQLALRDGCVRLREANIPVFIVHGNHDPLPARASAVRLPENVTVFGAAQPEAVKVYREGVPVAMVHGMSHATGRETRSLARLFRRAPADLFQVGLLHCTVDSIAASEQYAPASLKDFAASDFDYWALGHIHAPQVAGYAPRVVYPGSPQGLHSNEDGPHGCVLVDVAHGEISTRLLPLAPVRWAEVVVPLDGSAAAHAADAEPFAGDTPDVRVSGVAVSESGSVGGEIETPGILGTLYALDSLDALDDALNTAVEQRVHALTRPEGGAGGFVKIDKGAPPLWSGLISAGGVAGVAGTADNGRIPWDDTDKFTPPPPEGIVLRVRLTGRTPLDATLRDAGVLDELADRLRDAREGARPFVWIQDIRRETRPEMDMDAARERGDLLGETLRVAHGLAQNPPDSGPSREMWNAALAPLFRSPQARQCCDAPDAKELTRLMEEAALLCANLLEGEE